MSSVGFFCQAEDGIRYLVRSRGLGDVYKRQAITWPISAQPAIAARRSVSRPFSAVNSRPRKPRACLLYTSDAADERSSVDLGGRRIIKKKTEIRESKRQYNNKKEKYTLDKKNVSIKNI